MSRAGVAYLCPDMQVFFFCRSSSFLSFFSFFFALALIVFCLFGVGSHAATLDDVYDSVSSDVPGSSFCSSSSSSSLTLTAPRLVFYVAWAVAQSSPRPPVWRFRLRPGNNTVMYVTGSIMRLPCAGLAAWNISRCKATHKKKSARNTWNHFLVSSSNSILLIDTVISTSKSVALSDLYKMLVHRINIEFQARKRSVPHCSVRLSPCWCWIYWNSVIRIADLHLPRQHGHILCQCFYHL